MVSFQQIAESGDVEWCSAAHGRSEFSIEGTDVVPLCVAARCGSLPIVEWLLKQGASVNRRDAAGMTPLFHALSEGHLDVMEVLLESGASTSNPVQDLTFFKNRGLSYVRHAVEKNNIAAVRLLLKYGCEINQCFGDTPLHVACRLGFVDVARVLLEGGANVNQPVMVFGFSPLHVAVSKNHNGIIDLLAGVTDKSSVSARGESPVEIAAANNGGYAVRTLIKHGWDSNQTSYSGSFPLLKAAEKKNFHAFQALVECGCSVNQMTSPNANHARSFTSPESGHVDSYGVLHTISTFNNALPFASCLLNHHADINIHTSVSRDTPLHLAARAGATELVKLYLNHGANYGLRNSDNRLPFDCSVMCNHEDVCNIFLHIGAPVNRDIWVMHNLPDFNVDLRERIRTFGMNPASLCNLCRQEIRNHLDQPFLESVALLPVPKAIRDFISIDLKF